MSITCNLNEEKPMAKQDIHYTTYMQQTLEVLSHGGALLVSADKAGHANIMTIGWGTVGWIWGKPIFCVLVRPSRFTYELLEQNGEFTVNVPSRDLAEAVAYCGTVSGRNYDKFAEKNLTARASRHVHPPIIAECVVHYECRVVQKNAVIPQTLSSEIAQSAYRNGDHHTMYYGEILAAYGDTDALARLTQVSLR
jgi:flavin reductase (DIM6/NTAB) family NADH-FMN oxidoreductase RutF